MKRDENTQKPKGEGGGEKESFFLARENISQSRKKWLWKRSHTPVEAFSSLKKPLNIFIQL